MNFGHIQEGKDNVVQVKVNGSVVNVRRKLADDEK